MQLNLQTPFKAINKAYLKEKISRNNMEVFKQQLTQLFFKASTDFSEDTLKDFITEFLRNTWYNPNHLITINKERKDLSIHTGKLSKDPVAVIAEIKKMGSAEMMTAAKPNVKALHELVLYYLQERITIGNNEIKYLLATDVNNWVLIDANEFDKKIFKNTRIKRLYEVYVNDQKDNPFFYGELKKILDETAETITCTEFNLHHFKKIITNTDKADDGKLINLYKILSPAHLLKLSFANDSNSLDKNFYAELLHLVGLEEVKEGSKKLIQRKKESNEASLLENAIIKLQDKDCLRDVTDVTRFGFTNAEQYYNIALELCITWINRILFLKLLEAQLYTYHQSDSAHLFLNENFIHDFDELNNLFLQVLAEKPAGRRERLKNKFSKVPYLNSSLFERTELERRTIDISALDNNLPLPIHSSTVLKDDKGKRRQGQLPTLAYLFRFLDSYDFASEGKAEIQEENKTLINASVLGLIFEKINGYKDGSFFTPGFITMYMCRETLRRAVVQKFNEVNNWNCNNFEALQEAIDYTDKEKRQAANHLINQLTICDPAVGSGHFLVSALNELVSIKHDLKILQYRHNGQRIREYSIEIVNDELILVDVETEALFEYKLNQKDNIKPELQAMQETLFHEKETLIENCLFGVDINANSVKICRLRLWIELLKNAYYTSESNYAELETLPNIDINIKQGNSLISRFDLDADLSKTLEKSKWTIDSYKAAVQTYRSAQSKEEKRQMEELIDSIKKDFKTDVATYDPINKKLSKLRGELALLQRTDLFSADTKKKNKANKALEKLSDEIDKLDKEKEATQNNAIYKEAFEWRFEFPEVLDGEGKFLGFDAVIGNPPYGVNFNKKAGQPYEQKYQTFNWRGESYVLFIEMGSTILNQNGLLSFIIPDTLLNLGFTASTRKFILKQTKLFELDLLPSNVFQDATVDTILLFFQNKNTTESYNKADVKVKTFNKKTSVENLENPERNFNISTSIWYNQNVFNLQSDKNESFIINKIDAKFKPLDSFAEIFYGIKAYQVAKGNPKQTPEIRDNKPFTNQIKKAENWLPFFDGKHIGRYLLLWQSNNWINYGPWLAEPRIPEKFEDDKILIRKIVGKTLIAQYVSYTSYCNTLLFVLKFKMGNAIISYKSLLGIINSEFIAWYFRKKFQISNDDTFPQIMIRDILQFSIPNVSDERTYTIEKTVDKILSAKKENPKADTSAWEKEIDTMVYALYELTEDEIKLVEGHA